MQTDSPDESRQIYSAWRKGEWDEYISGRSPEQISLHKRERALDKAFIKAMGSDPSRCKEIGREYDEVIARIIDLLTKNGQLEDRRPRHG